VIWRVEHHVGSASAFHGRELPDPATRAAWVHRVDRPALVLGSTQDASVVDGRAAEAAGVEVVRRRSGGGAVLLVPGEVLWVDVVVPAGDPLWDPDVGRAAWWLGDVWAEALAQDATVDRVGGAGGGVAVHRGPLVTTPWSRLVCFAGLGPGEVTTGGRKLVGVSQRRTRAAARFQCALYARWDPARLAALLDLDADRRAAMVDDLAGVVATADLDAEAFLTCLARR